MDRLLRLPSAVLAAALLLSAAGAADAAGDAGRGRAVYTSQCSTCHSIRPNETVLGPSLFGVAGRNSGTLKGFIFTPAMKATKWVWTDAKLREYLPAPQKLVPGTRMTYPGLKNPAQADDLIAFLHTLK